MTETKKRIKKYEELTFADDFMFCKILQNNPELCRDLTELILGRDRQHCKDREAVPDRDHI